MEAHAPANEVVRDADPGCTAVLLRLRGFSSGLLHVASTYFLFYEVFLPCFLTVRPPVPKQRAGGSYEI